MHISIKLFASMALVFTIASFSLTSCEKETVTNTITVNDTINTRDTIYLDTTYTPITGALLSANKWMIQETRGVAGGSIFYYFRGGLNNTESFDNEYIQFSTTGTGSYVNNLGTTRNFPWHFTSPDNSKLEYTFSNTPATFTVTWENLRSRNDTLYFDEYFTDGNTGDNHHAQFIRIPKP